MITIIIFMISHHATNQPTNHLTNLLFELFALLVESVNVEVLAVLLFL